MDVDEAWCNQQTTSVDLFGASALHRADCGDQSVLDRNVGLAQGAAGSVSDGAAANDAIVEYGHGFSSSLCGEAMRSAAALQPDNLRGERSRIAGLSQYDGSGEFERIRFQDSLWCGTLDVFG